MTTMENALRKALGQPVNNRTTGDYKEIQEQKRLEEKQQKRLDELDEEESRFGFGEYERENEYGYKDLGFFDKGSWFPICSQCGSHKIANRGEGTVCDQCHYQTMLKMAHDDF